MNIRNKGQAAMEFLMTYGWALLVVLIAIAALAFFGLLNPSRFLPERCEIAPGLTCMDFNARTDNPDLSPGVSPNNITIILNNGIGQTMTGVRIEIEECTNDDGEMTPISTIVAGQTQRFDIICAGMVPNTRFRSAMTIRYNTSVVAGEQLQQSKTGYLVVNVDKIE